MPIQTSASVSLLQRADLEPVMGLELDLTWCTMGLVLLVLAVLLSALCSHCGRHSFELRDTTPEKAQSALIKVVKLEEAREHTSVHKDGTDGPTNNIPSWRSHLGSGSDTRRTSEDNSPPMVPQWRHHLIPDLGV